MNKTVSIGLAGFSFVIDEYAYIKLSDYLNALRGSLEPLEADEVMHDIEIRIVEIFRESLGNRNVVNEHDVEKVIAQIGKPEIIEEQEENYFSENHPDNTAYHGKTESPKTFFRDSENMAIGGVCSGLAHYFGVRIRIMRTIWLVLALLGIVSSFISTSLVILIYIILWVVIPRAKTASDFLKMKGKPLNFDSLKEQSNKVLKFANESSQTVNRIYEDNKHYSNTIGRFLRLIFGVFLGCIALFFFIALVAALWGILINPSSISLGNELSFLIVDHSSIAISITLFLTIFIPLLFFTFLCVKVLSPKTKLNHIGYVFGGLILIWMISFAFTASTIGNKILSSYNTGENTEQENIAISMPEKDSIITLKDKIVSIPENFESLDNGRFYYNDKTVYRKIKHSRLKVVKKPGNFEPYLVIDKYASGYNKPLKMNVPVDIDGNTIGLPNFVSYPFEYRLREYSIKYQLVVPEYIKVVDNSKLQYVEYEQQDKTIDNDSIDDNIDIDINLDDINFNTEITVNGKKWKILRHGSDTVEINNKKYPKDQLSDILDSLTMLKHRRNSNHNKSYKYQ